MAVLLVIAPAPNAPASPTVSPSLSPQTAMSSASVGTASPAPMPVIVVDDPLDGWAVTGVFVGAVASAVSIALAWRAVKIGQQANAAAAKAAKEAERANEEASKARAAVAAERRRTFELEVLRDLAEMLDTNRPIWHDIAQHPSNAPRHVGSRLASLPPDDLPFWRGLADHTGIELLHVVGKLTPEDQRRIEMVGLYTPRDNAVTRLIERLRRDVLDAIERRMHARDD